MAATHTWSVNSDLKTKTQGSLSDVVQSAGWRLSSTDTINGVDFSTSQKGIVNLDVNNIDPSTFISFSDLTEEKLLTWAKSIVDGDTKSCSERQVMNEETLARMANPPEETKVAPWVTLEPTE
tara:strand:- start:73 stop:441 length:369 start_codon:yes stop_codon:yes gene_type:complete